MPFKTELPDVGPPPKTESFLVPCVFAELLKAQRIQLLGYILRIPKQRLYGGFESRCGREELAEHREGLRNPASAESQLSTI